MKRGRSLFATISLLILMLSIEGCVQKNLSDTTSNQPLKYYNQLFNLKIHTDKLVYKENEKIGLWATFEYIGNSNQIVICHSDPYISFKISDGKSFITDEVFDAVLSKTVIEKNKLYQFPYQKSGGYDSSSPNADMWKKFYEEKDLYLPKGKYTIKVRGAFYLEKDNGCIDNNLEDQVSITVQ